MKILWITNVIFPEPSKALGILEPIFGGWMVSLGNELAACNQIEFCIASMYEGKELKKFDINNVIYYLIPKNIRNYSSNIQSIWERVCDDIKPDILHIHGTEYAHGLDCMSACPTLKCVISIQGLVGIYSRYYFAGISLWDIFINITLRDVLLRESIFKGRKTFITSGKLEENYLLKTSHVIGRTNWDRSHAWAINSRLNYHYCNECLREGFYSSSKWTIKNKVDYSIFLSQSAYPLKGLHQVLKAVSLIVNEFPGLKIRVAGKNIIDRGNFVARVKQTGYAKYIQRLLRIYGLSQHVEFLGKLDEKGMINEYKRAHVFICPSSIENSPNSLGEAQMLGVPTIGSFVGGIPDMIKHLENGLLYRFEEVEMLADCIRSIFLNDALSESISEGGIKAAEKRHSKLDIVTQTLKIYDSIISDGVFRS